MNVHVRVCVCVWVSGCVCVCVAFSSQSIMKILVWGEICFVLYNIFLGVQHLCCVHGL